MIYKKVDLSYPAHVFLFLIVVLFMKFFISLAIPLFPDEAYYWVWSLFPQLSYYDHPPFVSWLLGLGPVDFFAKEAVRWPAIAFGHLTLVAWFFIFKELGQIKKYPLWLLLVLTSPLLGLGSLIITPDLPLLVFWSSSILFFIRLLKYEKILDAFFLGISLGLGFVAKYMIALFIPLALLYLLINKKWNRRYFLFFAIVTFSSMVAAFPVLFWNYQNDFVSFRFQLGHGLKDESWDWRWPLDYLGGQLVLIIPLFSLALFKKKSLEDNLLKVMFWGPLVFFFLTSFKAHVELNWPIMSLLSFFAVVAMLELSKNRIKLFVFGWGLFYLVIFMQLALGSNLLLHEKIQEPFLYKKWAQELPQKYQPFYAINYQIASTFWFYTGKPVFKLSQASRYDFFETFQESKPTENIIYVLKQNHHDWPDWLSYKWKAEEVEKLPLRYEVDRVEKL